MESYLQHIRRRRRSSMSPDVPPERSRGNSLPRFTYIGFSYWAVHLFLLLLLFLTCRFLDERMPTPVNEDVASPNGSVVMFSETRARRFLTRLVALGPRPSGSYECEELATGMFLEEIAKIKASLVYISDRMRWVRCLALYCLMYYVVVTFTSYGIPFEYDLDRPRLRRLHMQHFTRRTCCNDVKSNTTENWLWIYPLDMRGIKDLPDYDEIKSGRPPLCNTETMYCDLPYYIPVFRSFPATHSLLSKMEDLPQAAFRTEVRILDKKVDTATSSIEYDLLFVGSDHVNLFITPISYWHLSKWSFNVSIPPSQKTYFLALNCGHFPCRWNVRLTFAKNDSTTIPSSPARLAVASQFIHGKLRYSSHLRALIGRIHADRQSSVHNRSLWKSRLTVDAWNSDIVVATL